MKTGFINASAYGNYTKGKNETGLEYSLNLRDYTDERVHSIYDYQVDGNHNRSNEDRKDHFGYTIQSVALRYTRSFPEHYVFLIF